MTAAMPWGGAPDPARYLGSLSYDVMPGQNPDFYGQRDLMTPYGGADFQLPQQQHQHPQQAIPAPLHSSGPPPPPQQQAPTWGGAQIQGGAVQGQQTGCNWGAALFPESFMYQPGAKTNSGSATGGSATPRASAPEASGSDRKDSLDEGLAATLRGMGINLSNEKNSSAGDNDPNEVSGKVTLGMLDMDDSATPRGDNFVGTGSTGASPAVKPAGAQKAEAQIKAMLGLKVNTSQGKVLDSAMSVQELEEKMFGGPPPKERHPHRGPEDPGRRQLKAWGKHCAIGKHTEMGCAVVTFRSEELRNQVFKRVVSKQGSTYVNGTGKKGENRDAKEERTETVVAGVKVQLRNHYDKEKEGYIMTDIFVAWGRKTEKETPIEASVIAEYFDRLVVEVAAGRAEREYARGDKEAIMEDQQARRAAKGATRSKHPREDGAPWSPSDSPTSMGLLPSEPFGGPVTPPANPAQPPTEPHQPHVVLPPTHPVSPHHPPQQQPQPHVVPPPAHAQQPPRDPNQMHQQHPVQPQMQHPMQQQQQQQQQLQHQQHQMQQMRQHPMQPSTMPQMQHPMQQSQLYQTPQRQPMQGPSPYSPQPMPQPQPGSLQHAQMAGLRADAQPFNAQQPYASQVNQLPPATYWGGAFATPPSKLRADAYEFTPPAHTMSSTAPSDPLTYSGANGQFAGVQVEPRKAFEIKDPKTGQPVNVTGK